MGAGKTTIGHRLSKELKLAFHDSDEIIESRNGVSISTIFDIEGEEGFREREMDIINELTQLQSIVLSTGGGAVIKKENREWLKSRGFVVYLHASIAQILERTSKDKKRPLLQLSNPEAKLMELQEQREPLYREVADLVINTDRKTAKQVVDKIYNHKITV